MGFGIGWSEILLIMLVALVVLGPKKLPDAAKSLGKTVRELRNAISGLENEIRGDEAPKPLKEIKPTPPYGDQGAKLSAPVVPEPDKREGPSETPEKDA